MLGSFMSRSHFSSFILPLLMNMMVLWAYTLLLAPLQIVAAQDNKLPQVPNPILQISKKELTSGAITLAVIFILNGLLFLLIGLKYVRVMLAVASGYLFVWLASLLLTYLQESHNVNVTSEMFWGVTITFGLVGILLCYFLQIGAVFFCGAIFGLVVTVCILSFGPQGLIPTNAGRRAFVYASTAVCAILAVFLKQYVLFVMLPVIGSYLLFLGMDFFIKTQFSAVLFMISSLNSNEEFIYNPDGPTYGMLAGFLLTALLGSLLHYAIQRRSRDLHQKRREV